MPGLAGFLKNNFTKYLDTKMCIPDMESTELEQINLEFNCL